MFSWIKRNQVKSRLRFARFKNKLVPTWLRGGYEKRNRCLSLTIGTDTWFDKRDRAIILFLWDTGVRASELCGLKICDLNIGRRGATIYGKGKKERNVPFGLRAEEELTVWLDVRDKSGCDYVFSNQREEQLTPSGLSALLRRRGQEAGIEGPYNPHAFRHGFAVAYLDNGGGIHNLQRLMGRGSLRSTEVYLASTDKRACKDHAKASPGDNLNDK